VRKKRNITMTVKVDRSKKRDEEGGPSQYSQREYSTMPDHTPMKAPSRNPTGIRGKKLVFPSPSVADKVKARRPLTRATTKKEILVKDDVVGVLS
jgi:hypothetical protein